MLPADPERPADRFGLPQGSVVPSADIWDDDWEPTEPGDAPSHPGGDGWMVEAQVVVHKGDGSDDEGDESFGDPDALRDDPTYDGRSDEALGSRIARWSRTSMVGAGLSAMGLGLQKVLDPKDPVQIEIEVDDETDGPQEPIEVKLDRDHPEQSVATIRPWLQGRDRGSEAPGE